MKFSSLQQTSRDTLLPWCLILIGLSVPISVAFDNILLSLLLLGILLNFRNVEYVVASHPVSKFSIWLFLVLFFAVFYGATPLKAAIATLVKYIDLVFIPIFLIIASNEMTGRRARYAFLASMAITLLISYLIGLGILPVMTWMNSWTGLNNPAIFHSHIAQNNMMSFAVFLALFECREASTRLKKIGWAFYSILGIVNILFMVRGRTGYLILFVLVFWFCWTTIERVMRERNLNFGWAKGLLLLAMFVASVGAYHLSSRLHDRFALAISEYQAWMHGQGDNTSIGLRLDFYSNSVDIVKDNPLFGVGTGGFASAYEQKIQAGDGLLTGNPHNEYLNISVQSGIIGLVSLLILFFSMWRCAPLLPTAFEQDAARGLVLAYLVNCTANSALMDHADGLFFAFMTGVLFARLQPVSGTSQVS